MTIYEIKRRTESTSPYFFTRKTLKFFHQTMKDFKVYKQKDNRFLITAPIKNNSNKIVGYTERLFNPINNKLEEANKMVNIGGKGKGSYNEYAKRYYQRHKKEISEKRKKQRKAFQEFLKSQKNGKERGFKQILN